MFMFTIGAALIVAAVLKLYVGESLIKVISSYKLWAVFSIVFEKPRAIDVSLTAAFM